MAKLLLCAGEMRLGDEWVTLDADPKYHTDFVMTIPPLPKPPQQGWDEIALIHGIEHFFPWEASVILRQCYEDLMPGGKLTLEQPNIRFAARVLCGIEAPLTTTPGQSDMWPLYGDPSHRNPLYMHKWGWTPFTLGEALIAAGFHTERITERPVQHHLPERDFRLEAVK